MKEKNLETINTNKGRTLCVGDQHGGFKAFLQVMERCKFDNKVDKLITLGDVADGWSETAELVEYLIHLQKASNNRHIFLRGNHDCLDTETELCTKRGWVKYNEIRKIDEVLGIDENGIAKWQPILNIIIKKSNYLNYYENSRLSMSITNGHRILYKDKNEYKYIECKDLKYCDRLNIPLAATSLNQTDDISLLDKEIKLVAWILTDGHIDKNGYITIYQSKEENIEYLRDLLSTLNLQFTEYVRQREGAVIGNKRIKVIRKAHEFKILAKDSKKITKKLISTKEYIPQYISSLSNRQLILFLNEIIRGDGSKYKNKNNFILYGTEKFLSSIQFYFNCVGLATNLKKSKRGDFILNISKNIKTQIRQDINKIAKIKGDFKVWCLQTTTTNFLVRREGKSYFTGNCWTGEWLEFGRANPNWLPQGGQATVESYIRTGFVMSQSHRDFFKNLHNYYIDNENRVFVHGGFTSHRGAGHEHYASDYYWDRTLWEMALVSHNSKDKVENNKFFNNHKEVYLGHTTTGNWKMKAHYPEHKYPEQASSGKITVPMNRCNVWNMDTGGGFEGKLTIMDVDTKQFWQSNFVKDLYPK
jgi:hypothetical protein